MREGCVLRYNFHRSPLTDVAVMENYRRTENFENLVTRKRLLRRRWCFNFAAVRLNLHGINYVSIKIDKEEDFGSDWTVFICVGREGVKFDYN